MTAKPKNDALEVALSMTPTTKPNGGLPALDEHAGRVSFFEFWPGWAFYTPIVIYILWLALRFRGPTLMTASNPSIPMSGFVGESKREVLDAVRGESRAFVSPYTCVQRSEDPAATLGLALEAIKGAGLSFPMVAKPDMGCKGAGVQIVADEAALKGYINAFPEGAAIVLQDLVDAEGEAGLFYVKLPGEARGKIIGQTFKYFPYVLGDGEKTLKQLIEADPRASQIKHIYLKRHEGHLDDVIPAGQKKRLAFAGSHTYGAIFRNGNDYITDAMTDRLDAIAADMGEFYVGRFDIRFANFEDLKAGKGFRIIEVNGAGGESTHIWDSRTGLFEAWATLFKQYRYLWEIGFANRKRGFKPASIKELKNAWLTERGLIPQYPHTH